MAAQKQQQDRKQDQKQDQKQDTQQNQQQVLKHCKVAILATNGFEQVELLEPRKALDQAGAQTRVVSLKSGRIRGWNFTEWGDELAVDATLDDAKPDDFDALMLPGGVMNPDTLRMNPPAVEFVRAFFDAGKPVAAICHAPWTIIEADCAAGRRIASWPSLKTDLRNAGAEWVDEEVCIDGNLVSSRKPDDIPAFSREAIKLFANPPEVSTEPQEDEDVATDASCALFVRLEAKPGREADVENFLREGLTLVEDEPGTTAWFGVRIGDSTFAIFDTFPDESGRQAHLSGRVAEALQAQAPDLLASAPVMERSDVLASKLPGHQESRARV
jgi:protease I